MKIAGFIKNSFVDFPGQIASVVFTSGCNFDCWYCHNHELIAGVKNQVSTESIFEFLQKRQNQIDGVVISGGEPTLHADLSQFIKKIKQLGYLVKLDTNGSNPEMLKEMLSCQLLDFVAMDIKAPKEKLNEMAKAECFYENITKSIELILNSNIPHEFRTTFVPELTIQDIEGMTKSILGAKAYALQKYKPNNNDVITLPHNMAFYLEALECAKKHVPNSFLRGF